jgi:hypothetical protein
MSREDLIITLGLSHRLTILKKNYKYLRNEQEPSCMQDSLVRRTSKVPRPPKAGRICDVASEEDEALDGI